MIPLVSILNLVNFAVPILLAIRIFKIYQINRSSLLFYFSAACFSFSFYWLLGALPGIVFVDLGIIGVLNIIRFIFLYTALFFIIKIPILLIGRHILGWVFSLLIIIGGILFVCVSFINITPSEMIVVTPYVYWVPIFPQWIELMTGILSSLTLFFFIITFVYLAWKNWSNLAIVRRSLSFIVGMGVMMIGGVFRFLTVGFLASYFSYAFSTLFVSAGLLIIADGILHEHRQAQIKFQK